MGRFDPREGEDYGKCETCGMKLTTSEAADEHRAETMDESPARRSHRTVGANPDRQSRIQSHVDSAVESAISDALDDLQGDIDRGDLTEEEVLDALRWHGDFADAWEASN